MTPAFAWPFEPIDTAHQDGRRTLVRVPARGPKDGFWTFARWVTDPRPPELMSEERRDLMARHGGYWSAHFRGGSPLPAGPTVWLDLRALSDERTSPYSLREEVYRGQRDPRPAP